MHTPVTRLAAAVSAFALLACADRSDPLSALAPAGDSTAVSLSATGNVPDCGFEGGAACPLREGLQRCDRGLKLHNGDTPANLGDDSCINDSRHRVGSGFRGTWADWALGNQRTLAIDEPINWVMHITTHNAFNNYADGYILDPNQVWSISDQLDLGSRGIWLDLHWFNGDVRLCHGREGHLGCSPGDRSFAYGIQEIATWAAANSEEIVLMDFEAYVDGHVNEVVEPLTAFFGTKIFRATDRVGEFVERWPSRRELFAMGKQIVIGAVGVNFGGLTHDGYMPATPGFRYIKNLGVEKSNGIVVQCTTVELIDSTPQTRQTLLLMNNEFRVVGDDRTRLLWLSGDHPGLVEPADMVNLASCQIPWVSLDLMSASRGTPVLDLAVRAPSEEQQPYAVWSWRSDDRGGNGNAALLRGGSGRWSSAPPSERHRFACGRARSETTRNPFDWTDRLGRQWRITAREGTWKEGGRACLDEYGDEGFVFSVPVHGYANGQLRLADPTRGDVWLNYNDIKRDRDWVINQRPLADAGLEQTVECNGHHGTLVHLDGRSSSDPDGDQITYEWQGPFGTTTGAQPAVLLPLGTHVIRMIADDGFGGVSVDEVVIEVVDTTPPEIRSAMPTPSELWAPNHKMVPVAVAVDVRDICDPSPTCRIVSVASNEPANGAGDGNTPVDWEITGALTLNLRAERSGKGDGRTYTITVECTDDSGNASSTEVRVTVPHDRGKP
jgi:hypothetical protein